MGNFRELRIGHINHKTTVKDLIARINQPKLQADTVGCFEVITSNHPYRDAGASRRRNCSSR